MTEGRLSKRQLGFLFLISDLNLVHGDKCFCAFSNYRI